VRKFNFEGLTLIEYCLDTRDCMNIKEKRRPETGDGMGRGAICGKGRRENGG
jgi:hypothetical protein